MPSLAHPPLRIVRGGNDSGNSARAGGNKPADDHPREHAPQPTRRDRSINVLTDTAIRKADRRETPYKLRDGDGLYLLVHPDGRKWWRFRYRFLGRPREISFGVYPTVPLARAREQRREARSLVAEGKDPSHVRRDRHSARAVARGQIFETLAREWLDVNVSRFAAKTQKKIRWMFHLLFPILGDQPIAEIEPPDLLRAIREIEAGGLRNDTAHRVRQLSGQVFRYAIATGRATRDPSADLKGALRPLITTHHAALTEPRQVGRLMFDLDSCEGSATVSIAVRLLPLLFVRPGELRHMEWTEVDERAKLWTIPGRRTKMRKDLLVPLSRQALALLDQARPASRRSRYVFPSIRTTQRPISENTLNAALRRLGYETHQMTSHGFRAMARTLLDEQLRVPPDVIEVQLGHTVPGALGDTYNRAKYLEQRRRMMQQWADYLDRLRRQAAKKPGRPRREA